MELPTLPFPVERFIVEASKCIDHEDIRKTTKPFIDYENKLRELYAQYPDNAAVRQSHLVPIFTKDNPTPPAKPRQPESQSQGLQDKYLLSIPDKDRKKPGSAAIVPNFRDFQQNFNLFSESSLVDLDWSNVVAAGSSVVTALLPTPSPHNESKRALRTYYHQLLAPASDVDLFIYGLNEEQAIEKIKHIESAVKDSILSETTTIRTKNAITIVSEYPTRHVQIVLRLYKTASEILAGFDVDCSCVAYDGKQVWCTPRAMAAYMTQVNTIDLTRRSPSYENRLSKYSHRGFEVFWPQLDRSRVDPTIYERSFSRVMGLARLLVLEKLPHPDDREKYLDQRRKERGRPELPWNSSARYRHALPGNVKDVQPDDVAEWVEEDEVSNYHTFTVPYGPKYNAKRIEKLLFSKDLLLNAEFNRSKDRDINLHRHPAFFGSVDDVIHDCCGFCPKPETDEDLAAYEEESKIFISGDIQFLKDNPGRQAIGSFHPLTDDDWTEQAYVGNTTILCQAIVNHDLEGVVDWFSNGEIEVVDPKRRDHAGRTPLLLATMCSTPEIVQYLVDHGARMVSRLYNGLTALHIAAYRGEVSMVEYLLDKSAVNEAEEDRKEELRKQVRRAATTAHNAEPDADDSGSELDDDMSEEESDELTQGSFVKVSDPVDGADDEKDDPDVFDIDVLAWDAPLSPLHLAIVAGHVDVVELLIRKYGADVLLPVKINKGQAVIMTLVLALQQSLARVKQVLDTLFDNGVITTQADMNGVSGLHYAVAEAKVEILQLLSAKTKQETLGKALNHLSTSTRNWRNDIRAPILTAVNTQSIDVVTELLNRGARPEIGYDEFAEVWSKSRPYSQPEDIRNDWKSNLEQPVVVAIQLECPEIALSLIDFGADVNTITTGGHRYLQSRGSSSGVGAEDEALIDIVGSKIDALRKYLKEESKEAPHPPPRLNEDDEYLGDSAKDTYQASAASYNLEGAKTVLRYMQKRYTEELDRGNGAATYSPAKKAAIQDLISRFRVLQKELQRRGAKTFLDQHPKAVRRTEQSRYRVDTGQANVSNDPYQTVLKFHSPKDSKENQDRSLELFEAAWRGDEEHLKTLTMGKNPLPVSVTDTAGWTCFSIAVARGHYDLARKVLEICAMQYKPDDDKPKSRMRLRGPADSVDSDDEDSSDALSLVESEVGDAGYTLQDIAQVSDAVQSKVTPSRLMGMMAPVWRVMDETRDEATKKLMLSNRSDPYSVWRVDDQYSWTWHREAVSQELTLTNTTLERLAVVQNDTKMLHFILEMGAKYCNWGKKDDEDAKIFGISDDDFHFAMNLGRLEMIADIIQQTGCYFPLQKLANTSGIKLEERPRYYQGLTVHGKKREDWAERARGGTKSVEEDDRSVVLRAVFLGNVQTAEYLTSRSPLERYLEFAHRFGDDKRLQILAKAKGGVAQVLGKWLDLRVDLLLHAAVMAGPEENGTQPVLDYVLRTAPGLIESKNSKGETPLHIALRLRRVTAIKRLLEAGADQTARNRQGENALHITLGTWYHDFDALRSLLSLFDKTCVRDMLMEKTTSVEPSQTPLAMALSNAGYEKFTRICNIAFSFSDGKDLGVLNGSGDYVIHSLIRSQGAWDDDAALMKVKFLIEYCPEMLYWENATGMTPLDVAETRYLRSLIDSPPANVDNGTHRYYWLERGEMQSKNDNEFEEKVLSAEQKAVNDFLALDLANRDGRCPSGYLMYSLLLKLAEKYPGKRKLVSIHDANEVAKRLASQQQEKNQEARRQERMGLHARSNRNYHRYNYRSNSDDDGHDETTKWFNEAASKRKWDFELLEAEVKRLKVDGGEKN